VAPGQPVPKGGGVYSVGKPYTIAGRTYYPAENRSYSAEGLASWYGEDFHGRLTANREIYDMTAISAAHPTLPLPSYVRVTNLVNGRSMVVRVNDRGPYHPNRIIDLSERAAELLGYKVQGTTRVRVEYVGRAPLEGSDDRQLQATLRDDGDPAPAPASARIAAPSGFGRLFTARPPAAAPHAARRVASAPRDQRASADLDENAAAPEPRPLRSRAGAPQASAASDVSARSEDPVEKPARPREFGPTRFDGTQSVATGRGLY
jgi:rare lipoprotein A